jgi:hypothetical protein
MMPRPFGWGKGPALAITPWMIDTTRSPMVLSTLSLASFLHEDGTRHSSPSLSQRPNQRLWPVGR